MHEDIETKSAEPATTVAIKNTAETIDSHVEFLLSTQGVVARSILYAVNIVPKSLSMPKDNGSEEIRFRRSAFRSLHRRGLTVFSGLTQRSDGLWTGGDVVTDLGLEVLGAVAARLQKIEHAEKEFEKFQPVISRAVHLCANNLFRESPFSGLCSDLVADGHSGYAATRALLALQEAGLPEFFRRLERVCKERATRSDPNLAVMDAIISDLKTKIPAIIGDDAEAEKFRDVLRAELKAVEADRAKWIEEFRITEHEDTSRTS